MVQPADAWNGAFAKRRPLLYKAESRKPFSKSTGSLPRDDVINRFLSHRTRGLDPPGQSLYSPLRRFLNCVTANSEITGVVLLDDRCDESIGPVVSDISTASRLWDSDGKGVGYMNYPPIGSSIFKKMLSPDELKTRLAQDRLVICAERRTIYIANITSECVVALAETVTERSLQIVRNFISQYISFRPGFSIYLTQGEILFNLEFHIPLFALRRGRSNKDPRSMQGRKFRASRKLPLPLFPGETEDFYHECQLSFLVTGVDEWVWNSYCFVDTYFGREENCRSYYEVTQGDPHGKEPATGGSSWLKYPMWNPREFFLAVLARRMTQVTREWTFLINTFEERMVIYQEDQESGRSFHDEPNFPHTEKLTMTVSTIRRFRDSLESTIAAWEDFEGGEIRQLETTGSEAFCRRWEDYLDEVRKNVSQLRFFRKLLSQKLDLFQTKLDGLVNASALRESATTTKQGRNIGILTKMTVLYLPLSLATGIFSMSVIPGEPDHLLALCFSYVFLLAIIFIATVLEARNPKALKLIFGDDEGSHEENEENEGKDNSGVPSGSLT